MAGFIRLVLIAMLLLPCVSVFAETRPWDAQISVEQLLPQNDLWEHAGAWGLEVKGIYWLEPGDTAQLGFAAGIALSEWKADHSIPLLDGSGSYDWSGKVRQTPLGVSLLNRMDMTERIQAIFELGLRYIFCESDLIMTRVSDDGFGGTLRQDFEVDCDSGFVGRIGGSLAWSLDPGERPKQLILKGGYQFDIPQKDVDPVDWTQTESQTLELNAFYLGVGLIVPL